MTTVFANARVLQDETFVEGLSVVVEAGRIVDVSADPPSSAERVDLDGAWLVQGFIDTQVNGGGGVLFNDSPTVEAIAAIGAAHRPFGTTGFLPTLITDRLDVVDQAMRAVEAAIDAHVPGVLGIHIEGPFLNPARAGVHRPELFQTLDDEMVVLLASLKRGRTLVTLAPERTTPDRVRALTAKGVIVAAGHTDATYEQTREALAAGVTGFTHLFNAMSPLTSRAPGVVGAALEDPGSYCGVIVDGRHVHPATLRLAMRTKALDRFMLVTDAMPTVGQAEKRFTLQGEEITVRDGVCVTADGTLAGSDLDMATAVRNAERLLGLPRATAAAMASLAPARFVGLDHERGRIAEGYVADFVALNDDGDVASVWIAGEKRLH